MAARTPRVVKLRPAVLDIIEIADHLARTGSIDAARRFIASVETTAKALARSPGMGALWGDESPKLLDVRFASVTRFRNHLIFYRRIEGGVELMRVLHAARDIERLLGSREDDGDPGPDGPD